MSRQDFDTRKNGRKKAPTAPSSFRQYEFVNMRLDKSEKAQYQAYVSSSSDELWDDLRTLIQAGYKLSVSYSSDTDCYIASLTCNANGDPNDGKVLVSRSNDFTEAVLLGVYKTTVLCKDNIWPDSAQADDWG